VGGGEDACAFRVVDWDGFASLGCWVNYSLLMQDRHSSGLALHQVLFGLSDDEPAVGSAVDSSINRARCIANRLGRDGTSRSQFVVLDFSIVVTVRGRSAVCLDGAPAICPGVLFFHVHGAAARLEAGGVLARFAWSTIGTRSAVAVGAEVPGRLHLVFPIALQVSCFVFKSRC